MGSLQRKYNRKKAVKKKKLAEKEMATKVALFGNLPNKCLACEKPFDKTDREQVMSWSVVVRQKEEKVNLYCPECWETACNVVKEFKEKRENEDDS